METQPLADSIRNIPPVTRFFTISTVAVCLGNALQIITPDQLHCTIWHYLFGYQYVKWTLIHKLLFFDGLKAILGLLLQSYRFFVCFLLPTGIPDSPVGAIMDIYFFYTFANHVERVKFRGSFPDCLWFSLVSGTLILSMTLTYNYFVPNYLPHHHLMMLSCITYIWSRGNKNSVINFLGIVPIKGYYLPLFNLFLKLIVSGYGAFFDSCIGITGGYLYQCFQSSTLPIYNLFPQFYPNFYPRATGNKVGTINMRSSPTDVIPDSVFDKGYLRAPLWLYRALKFPVNNDLLIKEGPGYTVYSNRAKSAGTSSANATHTASSSSQDGASSTATSTGWFSSNNAFKGKGHRLGS